MSSENFKPEEVTGWLSMDDDNNIYVSYGENRDGLIMNWDKFVESTVDDFTNLRLLKLWAKKVRAFADELDYQVETYGD